MIIILLLVVVMTFGTLRGKGYNLGVFTNNHYYFLEFIWTIIPAIILLIIAIPSFKVLYSDNLDILSPLVTLKVNGSQWYWTYSINDLIDLEFTSYPKLVEDLDKGEIRWLEVDNRVLLPINTPIRVLISANDVMHAWALPALGIKIDAVPGRINHGLLYILKEGTYYGQCSELCGLGHSYMPIVVEAVRPLDYFTWLFSLGSEISLSEFTNFIGYLPMNNS